MKWASIAAAALLAACQSVPVEPAETGKAYLVRHTEKTAEHPDPGLTQAGQARAEALADRLEGSGLTAIWSTDYARTRDTAAPVAARLGLEVQIYNPRDLAGFAAQLQANPDQNVLVVGHSNTTPWLASLLGAEPGDPIDEAREYDRLYMVDLNGGTSVLQRYGASYSAADANETGQ